MVRHRDTERRQLLFIIIVIKGLLRATSPILERSFCLKHHLGNFQAYFYIEEEQMRNGETLLSKESH